MKTKFSLIAGKKSHGFEKSNDFSGGDLVAGHDRFCWTCKKVEKKHFIVDWGGYSDKMKIVLN